MDTKMLRYAIEDAERFVDRAKEVLNQTLVEHFQANSGDTVIEGPDQKTIRRLSLDVTHAMKDLRDSIDSETLKTTA